MINFERRIRGDRRSSVSSTIISPGRTPIPCTHCNNHVKFDQLLATARQIGAERIATGHYARVRQNAKRDATNCSARSIETKDQSYFLFGLTQEQLARANFLLAS